jgi:peptidoglycan hydrolase-like protein with peptidoglycan-binding domain
MAKTEPMEAVVATEDVVVTQAPVTEPAVQSAPGQDTIPPTASVPADQSAKTAGAQNIEHNKEIQAALKAANFYTGSIDGKIGPKTKKAIIEFQKAHGLKADGRVGPKTWAELEKYLKR